MDKGKILILEDESIVAFDIESSLETFGYSVVGIASCEREVMEILEEQLPDLLLADINLKDGADGIELTRKIYKLHQIPSVYLTAFTDESTVSRAIRGNAYGYVIKPFSREGLRIALELAMHKRYPNRETKVSLGEKYLFDYSLDLLMCEGEIVFLGKNEKRLLKLLLDSRGNIVPFAVIESEIYGDEAVSPSAMRTLIYRLRSKLDREIIETIPSMGCKIAV